MSDFQCGLIVGWAIGTVSSIAGNLAAAWIIKRCGF